MSRYIPAIFVGGSAIFDLKSECVNWRFLVKRKLRFSKVRLVWSSKLRFSKVRLSKVRKA